MHNIFKGWNSRCKFAGGARKPGLPHTSPSYEAHEPRGVSGPCPWGLPVMSLHCRERMFVKNLPDANECFKQKGLDYVLN